MLLLPLVILTSYCIGSLSFSIYISKYFKQIDIRKYGSHNAGATNTWRTLGTKYGIIVFLLDFAKGFFVTYFFVGWLMPLDKLYIYQLICGISCVLGHTYPIFHGFKGGKGVLTSAGMLAGIEPISIITVLFAFLCLLFITRYVSLSSLISAILYPLILILLRYIFNIIIPFELIGISCIIAIFIIYKHIDNIKRLCHNNEPRIKLPF